MTRKITLIQALRLSGQFDTIDEIKNAIQNSCIALDGKPIYNLTFEFSPKERVVTYKGKILSFAPFVYYALNKPAGFSCQKNEALPYVVNLIQEPEKIRKTLSPIGRLDVETTGLLLITNDGSFSREIIGPQSEIPKTYLVHTQEKINTKDKQKLLTGVPIHTEKKKEWVKAKKVIVLTQNKLTVTITQGKKNQVRQMITAIGNTVKTLERIAIGNLTLKELGLNQGEAKAFSKDELKRMILGIKQEKKEKQKS